MKLLKLDRDSKIPPKGKSWSGITDDPALHSLWLAQGFNRGMPLKENNRIVVDIDKGIEASREFYSLHRSICTVMVLTRRGVHFHFSGQLDKSRKIPLGDLKASGYVVYAGSKVDGHEYRLIERLDRSCRFQRICFQSSRKHATECRS